MIITKSYPEVIASLVAERDSLRARVAELEGVLRSVLGTIDACMLPLPMTRRIITWALKIRDDAALVTHAEGRG